MVFSFHICVLRGRAEIGEQNLYVTIRDQVFITIASIPLKFRRVTRLRFLLLFFLLRKGFFRGKSRKWEEKRKWGDGGRGASRYFTLSSPLFISARARKKPLRRNIVHPTFAFAQRKFHQPRTVG